MKNVKKIIAGLLIIPIMLCTACTEALRVKHNLKQDADNFNIERRLSVINMRSDEPILELIGYFSVETDSVDNQLEVTIEVGEGEYKIDYIYLNDWTMYTVEDISGTHVDKYHYEINFLPQEIQPFTIVSKD